MLPIRRHRADGQVPNANLQYAGVGLQFALTFMVFGAIGYWLDNQWNTRPWLLIAGVFLGATGAFISLIKKFPTSRPAPPAGDSKEPPADD
jgi:F0F1-type ATP synthase assembly protein I